MKSALAIILICVPVSSLEAVRAMPAPPPAEAVARYRAALLLKSAGKYEAALAGFARAASLSPGFVEAEREYQNLMLDLGLQEELVREYEARLRAAPDDPRSRYLYGRLLDDPAHQEAQFKIARAADPDFFWARFGMAMIAFRRGDRGAAEAEARESLRISPASPLARRAVGLVESMGGRHERALGIFRGIIRDDAYQREAYESALNECLLLDRRDEGVRLAGEALALFPEDAALLAYRGYFLARAGEDAAAADAYERSHASGPLPAIFLRDLRGLYARAGKYESAAALWESCFGSALTAPGNHIGPLWGALKGGAESAPGGAESLRAAARALMAMGWWREAAAAGEAAEKTGASDAETRALLARAREGMKLLDSLGRFGRWLETGRKEAGGRTSFSAALRELDRATGEAVGRPLISRSAVQSAPGLKWLGERPGSPQPLLEMLREGKRELILFENVFGRTLGFECGEVISCGLRRSARGGFRYWAIRCAPSGEGNLEGESGLTYPPFAGYAVFCDPSRWSSLCDLRKTQRKDPLSGTWFLEGVDGRKFGPREIVYSRMLERRLFGEVCRQIGGDERCTLSARIEERYGGVVEAHEYQHLVDLRRYLPVWRHLPRCLILGCRSLFRPSLIEASFEERAIARSLSRGPDPLLALLTVHMQLNGEKGGHRIACRRVLDRMVGWVASHPREFHAIDTRRNILNQLYLLKGEEIARISAEVYRGVTDEDEERGY